MQLKKLGVKNFRLLHEAEVLLEAKTTVIVGRNNSGKTSLTEVMKRVLGDKSPSFRLEDFSFCSYEQFWNAFLAFVEAKSEEEIRQLLPSIEIRLTFSYSLDEPLGLMGDFIVDLAPDCTETLVVVRYALMDGKLSDLFMDLSSGHESAKRDLFVALRERVANCFSASFSAVDPNNEGNSKAVDAASLRALCVGGFISAQRGLDDSSQKERVVIGRVLESLFSTAQSNPDDPESHKTAQELEDAVKGVQEKIGEDFNQKLDTLLPALSIFGYPGVTDPKLLTETTLDVTKLLTGHTKVFYAGSNGIHLPEAYNGLGVRNIILILLQLREFYKLYLAATPRPSVQLIFVEEPEVHLHPQMQEVFIRKLGEIAKVFGEEAGVAWPVQFIVSTHSSHVANEAHFESIRYFHCVVDTSSGMLKASVKDLRKGLSGKGEPDRSFLHQYMTLTRCDLFFADKAILIEGTTERLLLPKMIAMIDEGRIKEKQLGSQYISVIEIGGAYAHIFFDLLQFLEIRALVITDIDAVKPNSNGKLVACPVSEGKKTSNACIKSWFGRPDVSPADLIQFTEAEKIVGKRRISFQVPESDKAPCGRSFEDAFMLANPNVFSFDGKTEEERGLQAWEEAQTLKKSEFALDYLLTDQKWNIPNYIREGLEWLSEVELPPPNPALSVGKVLI